MKVEDEKHNANKIELKYLGMKKIMHFLMRSTLYNEIDYDDVLARQRFILFRIFSIAAFLVTQLVFFQMLFTFNHFSIIPWSILTLSFVLIINYFSVQKISKLQISYFVALATGFLMLHAISYSSGGIKNSGSLYFGVIILCAFMLIGSRAGIIFSSMVIAHLVYLYIITENTTWTSFELFENKGELINQDYLTTGILAFILLSAQCVNLMSGKNIVIQRITKSRNELKLKNEQMEVYTRDLEKKNKELDKFASIVSHDLKAPLRAIGNLTGWIEEDAGESFTPEVKANFEIIKGRVKRMEQLINAILDYSKADRRKDEDVNIDVKKLIDETLEFIGHPENVKVNFPNELPVLLTEKIKLEQVFSNLINNAIKYCDKPNVEVTISSVEDNGTYTFSIKDNGPGIEKQFHEKIFIIFQTLNRRDDVESTGVGLAIVKKIIEEQGGKIWIESEMGIGSDFKFTWPTKKQKTEASIDKAA